MQEKEDLGVNATRARMLGSLLAFVATAALALQLREWWHEGHFRLKDYLCNLRNLRMVSGIVGTEVLSEDDADDIVV